MLETKPWHLVSSLSCGKKMYPSLSLSLTSALGVQVHRARLLDGTEVVMKIQYPGVAHSVESDLKNLQRLVQLTNILPPGLYIDEIIKVRPRRARRVWNACRPFFGARLARGTVSSVSMRRVWIALLLVEPRNDDSPPH